MKKARTRLWGILLVLIMLLSLMPVTALAADGDVAQVGEKTYETLQEAIDAAGESDEISLLKDAELTGTYVMNLDGKTINTNGYTITIVAGADVMVTGNGTVVNGVVPTESEPTHDLFDVAEGGTLTIENGTFNTKAAQALNVSGTAIIKDGTFTCTASSVEIDETDHSELQYSQSRAMFRVDGTLEFEAGTIDADSQYIPRNDDYFVECLYGIYAANGATVTLGVEGEEGGPSIFSGYAAIGLNNTTSDPVINITIYGGEYKAGIKANQFNDSYDVKQNTVVYMSGNANLEILGGTFAGTNTATDLVTIPYANTGTVIEISGGKFDATECDNVFFSSTGSSVTAGENILTITGGDFSGSFAEFDEGNTFDDFITGGTFSNDVSEYLPEGVKQEDNEIVADIDENTEAIIGNVAYDYLSEAITAAESGDTITLMRNATLSNDISIDKNLTIDGDGQYKVGYSEGYNPSNYAITVMPKYEFTLKDVEWNITGTSNYGVDVRYDAALTLDGAKLTISGVSNATISAHTGGTSNTNPGKFTLTNGSAIEAADIGGNFSNGGDWTLEGDSNITINGCDSYGLSVHTLKVDGSTVDITGVKYAAVKTNGEGGSIEVVNNGTIEVSESGSGLPFGSNYGRAESVVDLGHGGRGTAGDGSDIPNVPASLTVDETSSIVLTDNENKNGEDINYVYLTNTAELDNRGEITDVVMQDAKADSYRVVYMVNGQTYHVVNVESEAEDGVTTITYAEPADPEVDGYRFNGWDYGDDVSVKDGQVTITIGENAPDDGIYTFEADMTRRNSGSAGGDASKPSIRPDTDDDDNDRPSTSTGLPFDDVDTGDWYYEAVEYVYENGLMNGVASDEFSPNATLTRGMMVTILYRLEGEPAVSGAAAFDDVDEDAWYADAVAWAAENGIVNGVSDTEYAPNANITREQLATMLYRYAQYSGMDAVDLRENISGFADADSVSEYAVQALNWAVGEELVNGMGDNTLAPQGNATRAQAAALLMRYVEYVA